METTTLTLEVPSNQLDVHHVVHKAIIDTMAAGQATNGIDTWRYKDPIEYHMRKAIEHANGVRDAYSFDAREKEPPNLLHAYNCLTRVALGIVTWRNRHFQPVEPSND